MWERERKDIFPVKRSPYNIDHWDTSLINKTHRERSVSLIKLVSRQSYRDYTTNLTHITLWTHRSFKRSEETKGIERTVRPKCNVRLVVLKGRLLSVVKPVLETEINIEQTLRS